ncbi:MAG: PUR family DNA/RNA-binding protein [Treponema sp.]|jgi:hypothetical protein|nr:PUR family DNA/RNA-binding protein [Treponema sp.]
MGIRGEIFSTSVPLANRTYFFNVKENRLGDLYLNIVESKNRETGGFERQSVILFAEDLTEFLKGFDESLRVLEKASREKRRSAGSPPPGGAGRGRTAGSERPAGRGRPEGRERPAGRGRPEGGGRPVVRRGGPSGGRGPGQPPKRPGGGGQGKRPGRVVVKKRSKDGFKAGPGDD